MVAGVGAPTDPPAATTKTEAAQAAWNAAENAVAAALGVGDGTSPVIPAAKTEELKVKAVGAEGV
jgi:hypothetical protein